MMLNGFKLPSRAVAVAAVALSAASVGLLPSPAQAQQTSQLLGTLLGGVAGAALGSQFGSGSGNALATGLGGVGGAVLGSALVGSLQSDSRPSYPSYANAPAYAPAPVYAPQPTYAAQPVYAAPSYAPGYAPQSFTPPQQYCREFSSMITIDGVAQPAFGRACRQPNGTWRIVE